MHRNEPNFFFSPNLGKKAFSSAITIPTTTTTGAGTLPLLVVEAGAVLAEGPDSTCTISQDSRGDCRGRAGKYMWALSV